MREKTLNLRKYVQENESLEFRNQQLSKRVAMLQEDLSSPARARKKKVTHCYVQLSERVCLLDLFEVTKFSI